MPAVRLLADMNISPITVRGLRAAGWDVLRVSDCLPARTPDPVVLELARSQGRTLLTLDLDFSAIVAVQRLQAPSLVTLRLSLASPQQVLQALLRFLPSVEDDLAAGAAVTVDEVAIRVRPLPIAP
jgi:predicted nuclease of predicted toxin-antitoxin system